MIEYGDLTQNYLIEEGDIIFVPYNPLAAYNYGLQKLIRAAGRNGEPGDHAGRRRLRDAQRRVITRLVTQDPDNNDPQYRAAERLSHISTVRAEGPRSLLPGPAGLTPLARLACRHVVRPVCRRMAHPNMGGRGGWWLGALLFAVLGALPPRGPSSARQLLQSSPSGIPPMPWSVSNPPAYARESARDPARTGRTRKLSISCGRNCNSSPNRRPAPWPHATANCSALCRGSRNKTWTIRPSSAKSPRS